MLNENTFIFSGTFHIFLAKIRNADLPFSSYVKVFVM